MCSIQLFSRSSTFNSLSVSNTGLTVVKVVFEPTEANFDFVVELAVRPFVRPTSVDGARGRRRRVAGMSAARPIVACRYRSTPRLAGNRHRTRISPTTLELFYMKLFFVAPFTAA